MENEAKTTTSVDGITSGYISVTMRRWEFCPWDGMKFEDGWEHCPKCGQKRGTESPFAPIAPLYPQQPWTNVWTQPFITWTAGPGHTTTSGT